MSQTPDESSAKNRTVTLTATANAQDVEKILAAFKAGELASLGVTDITVAADKNRAGDWAEKTKSESTGRIKR